MCITYGKFKLTESCNQAATFQSNHYNNFGEYSYVMGLA